MVLSGRAAEQRAAGRENTDLPYGVNSEGSFSESHNYAAFSGK